MVLAIAAVSVGTTVAWRQYSANQQAEKTATDQQQLANNGHATGDNPSTKEPSKDEFAAYTVAAGLPRYLYIPKIDVKSIIRQVGLTIGGAVGTPTNIYDTAWYIGSAKPGEAGAAMIDGHISSGKAGGVFYYLDKLQPGDPILVERGDGQTLRFIVVRSQTMKVEDVDMQQVLAPVNAGKPGLNLITCIGNIIKGTSRYDSRIVVYAELE